VGINRGIQICAMSTQCITRLIFSPVTTHALKALHEHTRAKHLTTPPTPFRCRARPGPPVRAVSPASTFTPCLRRCVHTCEHEPLWPHGAPDDLCIHLQVTRVPRVPVQARLTGRDVHMLSEEVCAHACACESISTWEHLTAINAHLQATRTPKAAVDDVRFTGREVYLLSDKVCARVCVSPCRCLR
jgi:hypothetical protein